jgi:ABC-2 type transport system ATP-binding protein
MATHHSTHKPSGKAELLVGRDLTKMYPKASRPALEKFNISIYCDEIFGLLGPNGAGKTTAISIMSSTIAPTSGRITMEGLDVSKHASRIRTRIGLVPQDIALYPALTAHENLAFFGRIYGLSGSRLEKRIAEVLELVCLEEKAHQPVHTYSGGMKRRANLAVGLLHRPQLLYLDEPTVGIDAQSRFLILERLAALRDAGITMLYTTHYMEEAQKLCDRIAIMDEGQIIAEGTPATLLARRPECTNLGELFLALTGKDLRD